MGWRRWLAAMAAMAAMAGTARAHHAMEFIEVESYTTPRRGEKIFYLRYDYMVKDSENPALDRWELTPGLSYGITDRLMADVHTHFAKFGMDHLVEDRIAEFGPGGPSPFMEAMAVGLQYRLTEGLPVNAALSGTWEIPFGRAKRLLGSDQHVLIGTLILEYAFGSHGMLCANFTYEKEGREDEWGWALGVKNPISIDPHGIAGGVELRGDFEGNSWSVLPGIYAPLNETVMLKTGIEFGREKEENEWVDVLRANLMMMYRF